MAKTFDREAVINALIESGQFTDDDLPTLNKFNDDVLDSFVTNDDDSDEEDEDEDEEEFEDVSEEDEEEEQPTGNGRGKKKMMRKMESEEDDESYEENKKGCMTKNHRAPTAEEWLENAPEEIRTVVTNAMAIERNKKKALIKTITANERNTFTSEYLKSRSTEELEGIAALAGPSRSGLTANYAGANAAPVLVRNNARNSQPLVVPKMVFGEDNDE